MSTEDYSPTFAEAQEAATEAAAEAAEMAAFLAQARAAQARAAELQATITQREWILIRRALDATRSDIVTDPGLRLVALSWVQASREHGGASWDTFLSMTDAELLRRHGFPTDDDAPTGLEVEDIPPDLL